MDPKILWVFAVIQLSILSTPTFIFASSNKECLQFLKSIPESGLSQEQRPARSFQTRTRVRGGEDRPGRAVQPRRPIVNLAERRNALVQKYVALMLDTALTQKQTIPTVRVEDRSEPAQVMIGQPGVNTRERRAASNTQNRNRLNLPTVADKKKVLNTTDKIFIEYFQNNYGLTPEILRVFSLAFESLNFVSGSDEKLNSFEFAVRSLNKFDSRFYDLSDSLFKFESRLNKFISRFNEADEEFNLPEYKESIKEWIFLYFITNILSDLEGIHLYGNTLLEIATKQGLLENSNYEANFYNSGGMTDSDFSDLMVILFKIPGYKKYVIENIGPGIVREVSEVENTP